ncbi:MAG TPA: glycoside hydrolase family 5 protein [Polyangiaceae bacterium]|jgi:endoglucanase|nr:glycoside hydrolase family 5 protein [Polyangiaceae bacterium]
MRWSSFLLLASLASCRLVPKKYALPPEPAPLPTPADVVPVHQISEVEPPAVAMASEPLPGFTRGINLGNALDAPREGAWGVTIQPEHFSMAKAAGLDHVRLPVRFSAHAEDRPPYAIQGALFDRVDWALEQAQKNGLSIIIDLHHYQELMKKPAEHENRLVELWRQIALRYRDAPPSVAFELINEPCDELKPELLNPITARALAAVRASNPTRTVIVDSYFWANAEQLKNLVLPADPNLVASFHMYQPILFTHQGMPWMGPEYQTRGVVFPGPPAKPLAVVPAATQLEWPSTWFKGYQSEPIATNSNGPKAVFDYFKLVEDYIASSHRRVYMGEFGVADSADPTSRENWLRLVRKEAERRRIGWAVWDDGARFRAMNVGWNSWIAPIRAGLFD